ncbi:MAG: Ig domain-containing protein [Bacteroidales bacterium]|nr:Ig domain-containing protein [Bacteroidales bacterium]
MKSPAIILPLVFLLAACNLAEKTPQIESISIDPTELNLTEGDTGWFYVYVKPDKAAGTDLIYESSNPEVAEVSPEGNIYARKAGTAIVTVFSPDKSCKAECRVNVAPKVVQVGFISLNQRDLDLQGGETFQLEVTFNPPDATDQRVIWESDYPEVATVSESGLVTAHKSGYTLIVVRSESSDALDACHVRVTVPVTGIQLDNDYIQLNKGEYATIKASLLPEGANYQQVEWVSSNPDIVSVSNYGTIRALAAGRATITAYIGEITADCVVEVIVPVTEIVVDPAEVTLYEGETITLHATVYPEDATYDRISWRTLNIEIAGVDENGRVYAFHEGSTGIVAETGGKWKTCIVTVKEYIPEPDIVDLGLSVKWASCNMGASVPEEYGYYYSWGETRPKDTYSWSTYSLCRDGLWTSLTRYNWDRMAGYNFYVDYKNSLDSSDDAANVKLGRFWHMPLLSEFYELMTKCTWQTGWLNGVAGQIVTGPNGNTIFLPYNGLYTGNSRLHAGIHGYYWANGLNTHICWEASQLWITEDGIEDWFYGDRYLGYAIRPVWR